MIEFRNLVLGFIIISIQVCNVVHAQDQFDYASVFRIAAFKENVGGAVFANVQSRTERPTRAFHIYTIVLSYVLAFEDRTGVELTLPNYELYLYNNDNEKKLWIGENWIGDEHFFALLAIEDYEKLTVYIDEHINGLRSPLAKEQMKNFANNLRNVDKSRSSNKKSKEEQDSENIDSESMKPTESNIILDNIKESAKDISQLESLEIGVEVISDNESIVREVGQHDDSETKNYSVEKDFSLNQEKPAKYDYQIRKEEQIHEKNSTDRIQILFLIIPLLVICYFLALKLGVFKRDR